MIGVEIEVAAPTGRFETEAGVLAEVVLGVFGISQPVAPSSVPPVWHERYSGAPLDLNLLAFKPKSQPAPSVACTMELAGKFSSP